jgi:hypothetical protein
MLIGCVLIATGMLIIIILLVAWELSPAYRPGNYKNGQGPYPKPLPLHIATARSNRYRQARDANAAEQQAYGDGIQARQEQAAAIERAIQEREFAERQAKLDRFNAKGGRWMVLFDNPPEYKQPGDAWLKNVTDPDKLSGDGWKWQAPKPDEEGREL